MPIGVISNVLAVALGGIAGAALKQHIGNELKEKLNMVFGLCSMAMGISSIALMENMPAVVFSLILGTIIGIIIHLETLFKRGAGQMQRIIAPLSRGATRNDEEFTSTLITVIVLFCASGTGIYGSMVSGMSGDHSILIAKSILDVFTAMIFACSLGAVVSVIAIPQAVIFLALFFLARTIYPLTTPAMINDFKACGGFIMLATGFRIIRVQMFPTADMIPAMVLVMPLSALWAGHILPLLG